MVNSCAANNVSSAEAAGGAGAGEGAGLVDAGAGEGAWAWTVETACGPCAVAPESTIKGAAGVDFGDRRDTEGTRLTTGTVAEEMEFLRTYFRLSALPATRSNPCIE
jgi:hypothetical protein